MNTYTKGTTEDPWADSFDWLNMGIYWEVIADRLEGCETRNEHMNYVDIGLSEVLSHVYSRSVGILGSQEMFDKHSLWYWQGRQGRTMVMKISDRTAA